MKNMKLEIYGVIYSIKNKLNNKYYIGQTINGFDERYHNDLEKYTHNKHLKQSIHKYGIENFEINKILDVAFSEDELKIKEKCYIQLYNSYKEGYNETLGGDGVKGLPRELHGMYGVHRYGKLNPFYGKTHSDKTRKILSDNMSQRYGVLNPNFGNGKKIEGKRNPMYGISPSERMDKETYIKWRNNISKYVSRGNNPNARRVICITTGKIFECVMDGAEFYNCNESGIRNNCYGKAKSAGKLKNGTKLKWMYYDEYIKQNQLLIHNKNLGQVV